MDQIRATTTVAIGRPTGVGNLRVERVDSGPSKSSVFSVPYTRCRCDALSIGAERGTIDVKRELHPNSPRS